MRSALLGLSAILMLAVATPLAAQQAPALGDLVIAFEYDGMPPAPALVPLPAAPAVCKPPINQPGSVIVGKNGGVRDVLVQLFLAPGQKPPAAPAPVRPAPTMTNLNCEFVPHILLVQAGENFVLMNNDPIPHNMNVASVFKPINTLLGGGPFKTKFDKAERMPIQVTCNIHPFMAGWIVATDHPFVGVSDAAGKLVIKDLPVGNYTFQAWTERAGYVTNLREKQGGKPVAWPRGKFDVKIAAGQNDQGVFLIK